MIRVTDLVLGWTLWADTECHEIRVIPVFVKGGQRLKVFEMAGHPDAHSVFRELKRRLDINDNSRISPSESMEARGLDVAKFSIELALKMLDKWNPELKETGIVYEGAR